MTELLALLSDPAIPFFRHAFFAGLLSSVAFGIIGSYVVARRISSLAGAISHCVLGGIGGALYLQKAKGVQWLDPVWGAAAAALVAAVVIGMVSLHARQREDTVIGALWGIGMAAGLLFLAKTPGYVEPMSYLFGNILLMTASDVVIVLALDIVIVLAGLLFYNRFLAVCFDGEFARLRGISTRSYSMALLILTSLAIVLLVRMVGVVMVVALLTLPAAAASYFCRSLWQMMLLSSLCCALYISGGLFTSYQLDLPSGPTIIVIAGGAYLLIAAGQTLRRRLTRSASPQSGRSD